MYTLLIVYIYFYCIYFSEILALTRYSSIRVEIKFTTTYYYYHMSPAP